MEQFIKRTYNKFENKTTIEGIPCLMEMEGKIRWIFDLRQISTPNGEDLVIDIHRFSPEWFFLRSGSLIFNLDGKNNIVLEPHESYSDVGFEQGGFERDATAVTEENCFYDISKEELKEICDATNVDIQITGDSKQKQMRGRLFLLYARAFYNSVLDNTVYRGALSSFQEEYRKCEKFLLNNKYWGWTVIPRALVAAFLVWFIIEMITEHTSDFALGGLGVLLFIALTVIFIWIGYRRVKNKKWVS